MSHYLGRGETFAKLPRTKSLGFLLFSEVSSKAKVLLKDVDHCVRNLIKQKDWQKLYSELPEEDRSADSDYFCSQILTSNEYVSAIRELNSTDFNWGVFTGYPLSISLIKSKGPKEMVKRRVKNLMAYRRSEKVSLGNGKYRLKFVESLKKIKYRRGPKGRFA